LKWLTTTKRTVETMKKDVRCIQMQCNVNSPKIKCNLLQSLEKKKDDDGGECEAAHCEHQWNL
jgi:hypothetical protein